MKRYAKSIIWTVVVAAGVWLVLALAGIVIPPAEKGRMIKELAAALRQYYVVEDCGERMATIVEEHYASGKYALDLGRELLWKDVQADLLSVCNDEHLIFVSSPDMVAHAKNRIANIDVYNEADRIESEEDNHGIVEAKMLTDQVGYLRIDRFANTLYGKESLLSTLHTFKDASQIIIDMRYNNGGVYEQALILFSYFVQGDEPILVGVDYCRFNDSTREFWSTPGIGDKPWDREDVCVLTSGGTFSAGEAFAYDMKHHEKAVIVGERTRGGARSVDWKIIADHYVLRVPICRGIHPVTGTDFEGTGVAVHEANGRLER